MTTGFIHNPHDRFFRSAMAQVKVAREFFETHLPAEIRKRIDFSTLKAEKDTFIDDAFLRHEVAVKKLFPLHGGVGNHLCYQMNLGI